MSESLISGAYLYQPLNHGEIRLLKIHAGAADDAIETSLHHSFLADGAEYEALSYTWSKCIVKDAPEVDPETVVELGLLNTNQPNSIMGKPKVSKIKWKDLPRHEHSYLYYMMGGSREPEHIMCGGHDTVVGGELYTALKRLRNAEDDRIVWIDALCINQNDNNERAEQVALMSEIYARAQKVVIWLGENYSNVDPAAEAIYAIAEHLVPIWKAVQEKENSEVINLKILAFKADKAVRKLQWDSVAELLKRAWFRRVWCIQELVYAKEAIIKLGSWEMDWKAFAAIIGTLRHYDMDSQLWSRGECYGSATVGTIEDLRSSTPDQRPALLDLLRKTRAYQSTLPADKFFGLLNIVSDIEHNGVCVDYNSNPSKLYIDFAIEQMQNHNSLDLLYDCWPSRNASPLQLPSWVPNWTQPLWHEPTTSLNIQFVAAGTSEPHFHFDTGLLTMHVRGRIVDTIAEVENLRSIPRSQEPNDFHGDADVPPWRSRPGDKPWYHRERDGKPIWESSHENYFEEGRHSRKAWVTNSMAIAFPDKTCTPAQFENLWRTFVWDLTPDHLRAPTYYGESFSDWVVSITTTDAGLEQHFQAKRAAKMTLDFREEIGETHPVTEMMSRVTEFSKANARCYNRRFYRSVGGRFGWGVDGIKAGDQICIFYGATAPFILRAEEGGCHKVIGDTYIHGLMYGEGMKDENPECTFRLV